MLLSVPLTMVVKIGMESSQSGMWLAILLADNVEEAEDKMSALDANPLPEATLLTNEHEVKKDNGPE